MLNEKAQRELCYTVKIDDILPIEGADRVEIAVVGGWRVMVAKNQFHVGDIAVYFEIDSKVPEKEPFMFLAPKHFKVKTQKYFKGKVISEGLLMGLEDFKDKKGNVPFWVTSIALRQERGENVEHIFLTKELGVTYANEEDNKRKAPIDNKYKLMIQKHPKIFHNSWAKKLMKKTWGKKIMFFFFGRKRKQNKGWPIGKFPGVAPTDQERCENCPEVLLDKTPFIVTQKCDGSSGTYILERVKKNKFEFYVCSRRVRMLSPKHQCFYGDKNYYWEVAIKYDIEKKMKDYLMKHPNLRFVCWQGEICAPGIQKNPHRLTQTHFYCFHMTDDTGRYDLREARKIWNYYDMEIVPIVNEHYIMPDDFEAFKKEADGLYDPKVCEYQMGCPREGFVYYKTTDPTFSFKNVSRQYLLNQK